MNETEYVINTKNLGKVFNPGLGEKSKEALTDLNLNVRRGEIYGFLGQNGAGKTTTIKLLLGLIFPTSGEGTVLGFPMGDKRARKGLGYLPESPYYHTFLTAREGLRVSGKLCNLTQDLIKERIESLLNRVGLQDAADLKLREFSKGMLQRYGIAQALIGHPDLVIFDEPTSGLDPLARKDIRDILLSLKEAGRTIFFSSHILSEVEMISDRIAILHKGNMIAEGSIKDLTKDVGYAITIQGLSDTMIPEPPVGTISNKVCLNADDLSIEWLEGNTSNITQYLDYLSKAGARIVSVNERKQSLEDLFVELTKK